jgi:anti-sigma regulatory factor (Ser/Thr protein kinase)
MEDAHQILDADRIGRSGQTVELRLTLQPVPRASADARRGLAVFAESLPAETYSDLRLVVTELITNGVKYGPGRAIKVAVALDANGLVCGDVDDGGTGEVRMRVCPEPEGGGLGLVIVNALTSSWGVEPGSSQVWFELAAAGS